MPVIGIAPLRLRDAGGGSVLGCRPRYAQALSAAGATPVVLAEIDPGLARGFVAGLDGIVLPGGRDIPPAFYGDKPEPALEETLEDDLAATYIEIAREALAMGIPLLGICLGLQVMNVALGGNLTQHLSWQPGGPLHRGPGQLDTRHSVSLRPGSRLHLALGDQPFDVTSHHHQAINTLASGLEATAWAADGLIEGVEHAEHPFFVGVQWHPERSGDDRASRGLFEALVAESVRAGRAGRAALATRNRIRI